VPTASAVLRNKDGVTVREVAAERTLRRSSGGIGFLVTMPLHDLPEGSYAFGFRVRSDADEAQAERFVPIRLVSPR